MDPLYRGLLMRTTESLMRMEDSKLDNSFKNNPANADTTKQADDGHEVFGQLKLTQVESAVDQLVFPLEPTAHLDHMDHCPPSHDRVIRSSSDAQEHGFKSRGSSQLPGILILLERFLIKIDHEIVQLQSKMEKFSQTASSSPSSSSRIALEMEDEKELRRKFVQRHLALLLHAHCCQEDKKCLVSHCHMVKELLAHLRICERGKICSSLQCFPSRQLMVHWNGCHFDDCPVCSPLRRSLIDPIKEEDNFKASAEPFPLLRQLLVNKTPNVQPPAFPPSSSPLSRATAVVAMDSPNRPRSGYHLREPRVRPRFCFSGKCGQLKNQSNKLGLKKLRRRTKIALQQDKDSKSPPLIDNTSVDKTTNDSSNEKKDPIGRPGTPEMEIDSGLSTEESEDDACVDSHTGLWCSCRQLEKSRPMMICCDKCQFWYHSYGEGGCIICHFAGSFSADKI